MTGRKKLGLESLESRETPSRGVPTITLGSFQTVSGTVYADTNGNGARDAGENGVNGVVVYADLNNNGLRDGNEPTATTRSGFSVANVNGQLTTTDRPGSYVLFVSGKQLPVARVRVELPAGASLTTPENALSKSSVNIGLQGVTGTPDSAGVLPGSVVFGSSSGGTREDTPGRSSASVNSFSFFNPATGQSVVSISGSSSGNGSVNATSTVIEPNGNTITKNLSV